MPQIVMPFKGNVTDWAMEQECHVTGMLCGSTKEPGEK